MILEIVLLVVLLIFSFSFSGSETALFSIRKAQLRDLSSTDKKLHDNIVCMQKKGAVYLSTILIGNTLVNVTAASISLKLFLDSGLANYEMYNFLIMSFLVIIFGEVLPKTIALENNIKFISWVRHMLFLFSRLFYPFIFIINLINGCFLKIFSLFMGPVEPDLEKGELFSVLSKLEGGLSREERTINRNFLRLLEKDADSIVIHRSDMRGIDLEDDPEDIKLALRASDQHYIPVYEGKMDNIVGLFDLYSLFDKAGDDLLSHIKKNLIPGEYIPLYSNVEKLLRHLSSYRKPIFLVDEYGGIEGMLTAEHIMDMVSLSDETYIRELTRNTFRINPQTSVFEMEIFFEMDIFKEDGSSTILELFLDRLRRMPKKNDAVDFGKITVLVDKVENFAVRSFKVKVKDV
ncbi:DUF21 domain-containing protein [bacterium]|nr:DUF21 domain-containing protein [bacterium]